ncbi:MAG: hypothetical protein KC729_02105, partial [Candidatus Eisenbacteria bacterium]|nr:hypothetical protein [Candidatus Eisenbacteria bacterium]
MRLLPAPTSVRPHRLVLGGLALLACVGLTTAASAQWETSVPVVLAGSVDNEWTNQFSLALDAESRPHAVWNTLTGAYYS